MVRRRIADELDEAAPGPIRVLSLCAGDGRDLLGVLEHHERRVDVEARLIELDPQLVDRGRRRAAELGLDGVEFIHADAGDTSLFLAPHDANLVLACGIFGNIVDEDIITTIQGLAALLAVGGSAIWTRHRQPPDLTGQIREWFSAAGFVEIDFVVVARSLASVGSHRLLTASVRPLPPRLFEFVGDGRGARL